MKKTVYVLRVVGGNPFYVGITNNMHRRLQEHRSSSKTGTEAKYQYIREIESKGLEWEMVPLEEVDATTPRYEDFWVYTLIMEGYDLKNEKAGDARQAAEEDAMLEMRKRGQRFYTAKEFFEAREKEIAEAEARKRNEKLLAKTRKEEKLKLKDDRFIDWEAYMFPDKKPTDNVSKGLSEIMKRRKK